MGSALPRLKATADHGIGSEWSSITDSQNDDERYKHSHISEESHCGIADGSSHTDRAAPARGMIKAKLKLRTLDERAKSNPIPEGMLIHFLESTRRRGNVHISPRKKRLQKARYLPDPPFLTDDDDGSDSAQDDKAGQGINNGLLEARGMLECLGQSCPLPRRKCVVMSVSHQLTRYELPTPSYARDGEDEKEEGSARVPPHDVGYRWKKLQPARYLSDPSCLDQVDENLESFHAMTLATSRIATSEGATNDGRPRRPMHQPSIGLEYRNAPIRYACPTF
jgi:hypothetical protein